MVMNHYFLMQFLLGKAKTVIFYFGIFLLNLKMMNLIFILQILEVLGL